MDGEVSRPLRVLHVIDSEGVYGAESVMLDLCSELANKGHVPIIASIGSGGCGEKAVERDARLRGLAVRAVRFARGPNPYGALELVRLARLERADIIHTHGYKPDILLGFLPKPMRPAPWVVTVHGYADVGWADRTAFYNLLDRVALRRADWVVLVHQGMATKPGLNRLQDRRWRVIENGIRATAAPKEPSCGLDPSILAACRSRGPVIGAIARLSREKGLDVLLRAVAEAFRGEASGLVVILGEGPEREALQDLAATLGLADRVLMPGYTSHVKDYLKLFDLFVLPSLTEGLPIALLEAMQAGVPIVATRVGGVPPVLDQGRGGLLVDPGNPRALAAAIRHGLNDRASVLKLAAHSRDHLSVRFSSSAMTTRYLQLYDQALEVWDRPPHLKTGNLSVRSEALRPH